MFLLPFDSHALSPVKSTIPEVTVLYGPDSTSSPQGRGVPSSGTHEATRPGGHRAVKSWLVRQHAECRKPSRAGPGSSEGFVCLNDR